MLAAEWFPQEALLLAYPHEASDWAPYLDEAQEFFDELIAIVTHYQPLHLIAPPSLTKEFPNTTIHHLPTNDTWVRDYGPLSRIEKGRIRLLDFTFNGWGLKYPANLDNQINRRLFQTRKIGFVLEGGAIESNGTDTLLTTASCLLEPNRNPHLTRSQIEGFLLEHLGAKRLLWLESGYLEGDDTDGHIDLLARFVAPDHIVYVRCDDPRDPHYSSLQQMAAQLQTFGYKLTPLPWVSPRFWEEERLPASYANFLLINGAVIVPTYNDPNDQEALAIFAQLFPTRDIIALDAEVLIRQRGSIHCCAMNLYKG
ncbi:MAG: agmatine deiminase [Nitratiruptor sp.]|nr:agmatine deiminase [Nitratiruptor sp.]NPA83482.1 agmatine deiminase family protein [Campylobacterota bacterium]